MPDGVNANTLAYQYEKVIPRIVTLFQRDHTLFDKIEKRNVEVVSSRAMRIPLDILAGGKFRQVDADGGDFGRGSAITAVPAQLSPVFFAQATEFTKLLEASTDNKEKAVEPAAKRNLEAAIDQMRAGIESLLNSDGSGTLDAVVTGSSASAVITVHNANQFYDNQDIGIFDTVGGSNRGTRTILSVDANAKTITLTANAPSGTTSGDLLVVDGGSGAAASSLLGLLYHNFAANTGTWLQLTRSAYPGKLISGHISGGSGALTAQMVRAALAQVRRALGIETPDVDNLMWHMDLDQEAAWENVGTIVTQVIQNQLGGSESQDMLKRNAPKTMGDRPVLASIHATPGRIDGICLKHWGRGETQPVAPLEFGGQTLFPVYGTSGGLSAATISYLWCGFNVFTDNPRAATYIDSLALPANF